MYRRPIAVSIEIDCISNKFAFESPLIDICPNNQSYIRCLDIHLLNMQIINIELFFAEFIEISYPSVRWEVIVIKTSTETFPHIDRDNIDGTKQTQTRAINFYFVSCVGALFTNSQIYIYTYRAGQAIAHFMVLSYSSHSPPGRWRAKHSTYGTCICKYDRGTHTHVRSRARVRASF